MNKHIHIINLSEQLNLSFVDQFREAGHQITYHPTLSAGLKCQQTMQYDLTILCVHASYNKSVNGASIKRTSALADSAMANIEIIKQLVNSADSAVMLFSNQIEPRTLVSALNAGADDCIAGLMDEKEVVARINACLRRTERRQTSRQVNNVATSMEGKVEISLGNKRDNKINSATNRLNVNDISLCMNDRQLRSDNLSLDMTGLEFNLLSLLMRNASSVVSREHIGECIFHRNISYCDQSLNMHISNIRKKLKHVSQCTKIKTIRGEGYTLLSSAS